MHTTFTHTHSSRVKLSFYSTAEKLLSLISILVLTNQVTNLETMRNELTPIPPTRQPRRARRQQFRSNVGNREPLLALGPLISQKANQVPRAGNVRSIISNFSTFLLFHIFTTWSCCKELKKMNPMASYLLPSSN